MTTFSSTDTRQPPTASGGPIRWLTGWRLVARFAASVGLAIALLEVAWHHFPNTLSVSTDIVGYPIFANYDYVRYQYGYYFVVAAFPLLSILIYHVLAWKGPLRRTERPTRGLFPITTQNDDLDLARPETAWHASPGSPSLVSEESPRNGRFGLVDLVWLVSRIGLPATAIAFEVAAVIRPSQRVMPLEGYEAALAYAVLVVLVATGRDFLIGDQGESQSRQLRTGLASSISKANSLMAITTLPLLYLVSNNTGLFVKSMNRTIRYPWLPLWLVIAATALVVGLWIRSSRASRGRESALNLERQVLTWVVGPVLLFLTLAKFPGSLGPFSGFDDAQFLAAPQLVFHAGLFPWRDVYFLHGLTQDVFSGAIGMLVFGNTRWGVTAGIFMILNPVVWLVMYSFVAYFTRKNRLVLLAFSIAVISGLLQGGFTRFILVPIFLILFAKMLETPSWFWCSLFTLTLLVSIVTAPETALFAVCLLVLTLLFEFTGPRDPQRDEPWRYPRTIRCAVSGVGFTAILALVLAVVGALGSFVEYFVVFAPSHALWGAYPLQVGHSSPSQQNTNLVLVWFEMYGSVLLVLATIWRVVAKLRSRRVWTTRDWVLVGAASFVLVYYGKFLDRPDYAHLVEVFSVAIPLVVLWIIEATSPGFRRRPRRRHSQIRSGGSIHLRRVPVTGAVVVAVVVILSSLLPVTLRQTINGDPSRFHAVAPVPPVRSPALLGYTIPGAVDINQINLLGQLLNRYAGESGPIFDFANEIGVTYYFLERRPATRFFVIATAQTKRAQDLVIDDLKRTSPRVVIYAATDFGLPYYDGVPQELRAYTVGQYILNHYSPLVEFDGQLLFLRNDLRAKAPPLPLLPPGSQTADLYFSVPICNFGYIPNFFARPRYLESESPTAVPLDPVANVRATIKGWSVDATGRPVRTVVAVADGRIVGQTTTNVARPDVSSALDDPAALTSGFTLTIPNSVTAPVSIYGVSDDESVSPLPVLPSVSHSIVSSSNATAISISGIRHPVKALARAGAVDGAVEQRSVVYRLEIPPRQRLADYSWIEVRRSSDLGNEGFVLTNDLTAANTHQIAFQTLPRSGQALPVGIGSCPQWRGYDSSNNQLYMIVTGQHLDSRLSLSLIR